MLWFNFILGSNFKFPLFQTHYHQITINKKKEIKFKPRIKLKHNTYTTSDNKQGTNTVVLLVCIAIVQFNELLNLAQLADFC